ncbi:uncharacterized protein BKA78DRAFT_357929 [Phyllosticta capitalensis]|uniref:uncharacterized protein n=1 Tax=Phyllosticta capitalensis TaxID=121624 RepID=UPI003131179A
MTGECFNCSEVGHNKADYVSWAMPSRSCLDAPKCTSVLPFRYSAIWGRDGSRKAMGHFAHDYPEEKQMTGECFNYGEVGYNKAGGVLSLFPSEQMGHFARDCPEEKQMTGKCFNCGEVCKADCTNPRVFRGECRHCKQEGHPAAECPDKPAALCRNCKQEGHDVLSENICTISPKNKGKILVHEVGH